MIYLVHEKFRKNVVKDVKASKSDYFKNYFLCNKTNIQKIWSGIRSVIPISKVKANYIPSILESGKIFPNGRDKSRQMEYLLANIIFMFFHGLFISCLYGSDYVTLLNMTWTRD